LVGDIGKQLQDLTGIPSTVTPLIMFSHCLDLPKILKAKYRGLKKVIETFPHMFQIGTDHIINPTIYLKERRPASTDHDSHSPNPRAIPDYPPTVSQNLQFQHNRNAGQSTPQPYSQYSNPANRSMQENPRGRYSGPNTRQADNYYRSNVASTNPGGYSRGIDRGMHQPEPEDLDQQYYYDQYGYSSGQPARSTAGYSNNYTTNRSQAYPSRGAQQYPPEYEYDSRWNQQESSRQSRSSRQPQREVYGDSNSYQGDRSHSRDSRLSQPQTWAAYQEFENPNQRNPAQYYPRNEQRGGRQSNEEMLSHERDDYRRTIEFDPAISQYGRPPTQETQSSRWLDIEGLMGNDNQYNGGLDATLDLNFDM
jgi:hypothetical protein